MAKFTFKTDKSTGKFGSFFSDVHNIKLNKIRVGLIGGDKPHKIRLMVIKKYIMSDGNKNCPWEWIQLKHESESLDAAKIWLNENIEQICKQWTLVNE